MQPSAASGDPRKLSKKQLTGLFCLTLATATCTDRPTAPLAELQPPLDADVAASASGTRFSPDNVRLVATSVSLENDDPSVPPDAGAFSCASSQFFTISGTVIDAANDQPVGTFAGRVIIIASPDPGPFDRFVFTGEIRFDDDADWAGFIFGARDPSQRTCTATESSMELGIIEDGGWVMSSTIDGMDLSLGGATQFNVTVSIAPPAPNMPVTTILNSYDVVITLPPLAPRAEQVIDFGPLEDKTFGAPPFTITASATSGRTVRFSASGDCTVALASVTLTGAGSCTIRATQIGDLDWLPAPPVSRTFGIAKGLSVIEFHDQGTDFDSTVQRARAFTTPNADAGLTFTYSQNGSPVTDPFNVGIYEAVAMLTHRNWEAAPVSATFEIRQARTELDWFPHQTSMEFGTPLGEDQLNAIARVSILGHIDDGTLEGHFGEVRRMRPTGAYIYTPPQGTVLPVGSHQVVLEFIPDDPNFRTVTKQRGFVVLVPKAPATIIVVDPQPTYDGSAKAALVTTDPPGLTGLTITYRQVNTVFPNPVNAGFYDVVATLENEEYRASPASGLLTIQKATPQIHWPPPEAIVFGTRLGQEQLNASATGVGGFSLSGLFLYNPSAGILLGANPSHTLSVEFRPTDPNYRSSTATVSLEVTKAPATIALTDPEPTFDGSAKAASAVTNPEWLSGGLRLTYSRDGNPIAQPVNAGVYHVIATLEDDNFEAPPVNGTLTIHQATPEIHWASPAAIVLGTPLGPSQLNASATGVAGVSLSGNFTYSPVAGTVLPAGPSHTLSAEFRPDNSNYKIATGSVTLAVQYAFTGFFQPVDNPQTVNAANAGSAIPVKFSLGGDQGLGILDGDAPTSRVYVCGSGGNEEAIEETLAASNSGLAYEVATGQYRYIWKTDKSWAGSCRRLMLSLIDGTRHEALFRFK